MMQGEISLAEVSLLYSFIASPACSIICHFHSLHSVPQVTKHIRHYDISGELDISWQHIKGWPIVMIIIMCHDNKHRQNKQASPWIFILEALHSHCLWYSIMLSCQTAVIVFLDLPLPLFHFMLFMVSMFSCLLSFSIRLK